MILRSEVDSKMVKPNAYEGNDNFRRGQEYYISTIKPLTRDFQLQKD